jgi:lipopolysaccharide/colanic/teichoic acid biosynthesis glycosyltransferase
MRDGEPGIVMQKHLKASEENAAKAKAHTPVSRVWARAQSYAMPAEDLVPINVVREGEWARHGVAGAEPPIGGWSKRLFDICFAAAAIVALAPLLALVALLVRLDSPGQAIFRQERGGFNGRTFRIWKFRTMSVMENRGVVQARRGDARITSLGAFLRRSSWDELPQLFNVLMGDMSIIGPRPHALEHDIQFERVDPRYPQRQRARPGLTGLAQVNGCRGPTETEDKIRARTSYDVEYVRNWSWAREFKILADTVIVLFWKNDPGAL